jgi:LCP family protein required for cell wall assembly
MQNKEKHNGNFRVLKVKTILVFQFLFVIGIALGIVLTGFWTDINNSYAHISKTQNHKINSSTDLSAINGNNFKSSDKISEGTQSSKSSVSKDNSLSRNGISVSNKTTESGNTNKSQIIKNFNNSGADSSRTSDVSIKRKYVNILLVGVDRRPGEISLSNTDTLLVASINTENGKVALLSIPRDTQVMIPGHGKDKINAAARVGQGLKTTTALIEKLIAQPIDGYILTNFSGFKEIIDTLGGITITVEKNMHYVTGDKTDGVINLAKGTQRMNGTQALQYARFRKDALADISRTSRQQKVLKAIEKEVLNIKTVPKIPWLLPQLSKAVETNLPLNQLWEIANVLIRTQKNEIPSQTLPGNFLTEDGISYWKVDSQESQVVVRRLFEQGKTTSVFFPMNRIIGK